MRGDSYYYNNQDYETSNDSSAYQSKRMESEGRGGFGSQDAEPRRDGFRGGFGGRGHSTNNGSSGSGGGFGGRSGFGGRGSFHNTNSYASGSQQYESRSSTPLSFDSGPVGSVGTKPLPPLKKEFYSEHPKVTAQSDEQVEAFRREHQMVIQGRAVPKPITSFDQCGFSMITLRKLAESGFQSPTPIQAQGWPMGLSGRNMVGIAQTGSGKTLSYLLPAITHIKGQEMPDYGSNVGEPIALVLAPTRELAIQIQEVARQFGNAERIKNAVAYGGAPRGGQLRMLAGSSLVIATPGRLNDFIDAGQIRLERVSFLVLDEADRMLDMGFEPQIRQILNKVRPDRQVLLWSATWPKAVQRLAHDMLGRDFIQVTIGSAELSANRKIKQTITVCAEGEKEGRLVNLLQGVWESTVEKEGVKEMPKTIVFTNTKRAAEELTWKMMQDNWAAAAIHGDKSQYEREEALRRFRRGEISILVATDVAARGLDIKDVRVVVNYDFPKVVEDYIHRIGRTARGSDTEGSSFAFFTIGDKGGARELCNILRDAGQPVPADLEALLPRGGSFRGGNGGGNGNRNGRYGFRGGYSNHGSSNSRGSWGEKNARYKPY